MKFVVGENVRKPDKKPTHTLFCSPRNPHGLTEMRPWDLSALQRCEASD